MKQVVKVDHKYPEATLAIIKLLKGLGFNNDWKPESLKRVSTEAGWLYLNSRQNVYLGWDKSFTNNYNKEYEIINTTNQPSRILELSGVPVEISEEDYQSLKKQFV